MKIVVLDGRLDSYAGRDGIWDVMILCIGSFGGSFPWRRGWFTQFER
jgi:hypothetical protein